MTTPRVEGMVVDRLLTLVEEVWDRRVGLVVAPPGAGKTTLLATYLSRAEYPVAWYRADRWDDRVETLARRLATAFAATDPGHQSRWTTISDVDAGLREWDPPRAMLVIDDLHVIADSGAETAIGWLADRMPEGMRMLIASRVQPAFNVSRMRVAGDLLDITADDLRLRTWEVERLFREHYGEPLTPEDAARLAQWSEGWAAGLQLFHLATAGRPPGERRLLLRSLGPRSRLVREYLGQNVLDRAGGELRRFLVESSVLSRLDARVCDRFLARSDSAGMLEELERRCLFTMRLDDEPTYRYHEVFRAYLQGVLLAAVGESEARRRFREAAALYAASGDIASSLEAYARAEAWDIVDRILTDDGESIADSRPRWLHLAPPTLLREDPWLALAAARRLRAEGRFHDAVDAYASILQEPGSEAAASATARERAIVVALLDPSQGVALGERPEWWSLLREGVAGDPMVAAERASLLTSPESRLVRGLCLLLCGRVREAQEALEALANDREAEGATACAAWLACATASLLAGDQRGAERMVGAIDSAEEAGWEWMARIGRSLLALTGDADHRREARRLRDAAAVVDDRWGAVFACLAEAWGTALWPGDPVPLDDDAERGLEAVSAAVADARALGATTVVAWAEALAAFHHARRHGSGQRERVRASSRYARARRVEGAIQLTDLALAIATDDADACQRISGYLHDELGFHVPVGGPREVRPGGRPGAHPPDAVEALDRPTTPPLELRLLGRFRLAIEGREVDVGTLRPRVRSLLRFLALHAGESMHREAIEEAFWPGAPPEAATRNLHVAVAALRRLLEPAAQRNGFRYVIRDGETYALLVPTGSRVDLLDFEAAVARLNAAEADADASAVEHWCRVALGLFDGDLLPEEGPSDWIVTQRESTHLAAVEAASTLARLLGDREDWGECASVCSAGLRIDRYHDGLWRTLIRAREALGDRAAAMSARARYRRALSELEVAAAPAP